MINMVIAINALIDYIALSFVKKIPNAWWQFEFKEPPSTIDVGCLGWKGCE